MCPEMTFTLKGQLCDFGSPCDAMTNDCLLPGVGFEESWEDMA